MELWPYDIISVISGEARGVDKLGEMYAEEKNLPCFRYPADWDTFGKKAGYLRNAGIVLWDGESKGTQHTIKLLQQSGKPYAVYEIRPTIMESRFES